MIKRVTRTHLPVYINSIYTICISNFESSFRLMHDKALGIGGDILALGIYAIFIKNMIMKQISKYNQLFRILLW